MRVAAGPWLEDAVGLGVAVTWSEGGFMRSLVRTESTPGTLVFLVACALAVTVGALPGIASAAQDGVPAAGPGTLDRAPAKSSTDASKDAPTTAFKWNWDNTITYGLGMRLGDPDKRLIAISAGGTAYSANGDDGNQNYKKGLFTNAAKITSELEFSYKNVGGFVRGFGFYDIENANGDRARTPLSEDAKDRVGRRAEIRDAFVWYRYDIANHPGEIRAGWQVINWGESTFIQGGINAVNPIDVSALRVPGSEVRDALLPVGAVKASIKPTANTSIEGFYQFAWEPTKVDPVGSYFSTSDVAGAGASRVMLGFGSASDTTVIGTVIPTNPIGVAVPKAADDVKARDGGQYGVALRYFSEKLSGTEFGLYFLNYHSRLPLLNARTGTQAGLLSSWNYAASASYYLEYPEDIKLFGGSFNAQLGRTGIALQAEVAHRRDLPLQMDDVELLYAALTPLRNLPAIAALAQIRTIGTVLALTNQVGAFGFSEDISGYKRFNTTQAQATATKSFSRIFGADQVVLVAEGGWGLVHDFPNQYVLRLEAPGTYTTGNRLHTVYGIQPATEDSAAFPTASAVGYVLAGRAEYANVIGAGSITPRFSFSHDVKGISPGPGGNFLEGRKALTLGIGMQYRFKWEFDVSYSSFFGAGRYNLLTDRDFVAANIKYSF
jgi:hypothetical protein